MTFKSNINPNILKKELPNRLKRAAQEAGRAVSSEIVQEVKKRIPDRGGWYEIYRNALNYKEDQTGLRWNVDGLAEIKFSAIPADESLIRFEGKGPFGSILRPYNPWPLDLIPVIAEGYSDDIVTEMAGEGGVESERTRLLPLLDLIRVALKDEGASLEDDSGLLSINGRVYADIAFMARRLELGYSGFPHIPHWDPTIAKSRTNMGEWLSHNGTAEKINKIIRGG